MTDDHPRPKIRRCEPCGDKFFLKFNGVQFVGNDDQLHYMCSPCYWKHLETSRAGQIRDRLKKSMR